GAKCARWPAAIGPGCDLLDQPPDRRGVCGGVEPTRRQHGLDGEAVDQADGQSGERVWRQAAALGSRLRQQVLRQLPEGRSIALHCRTDPVAYRGVPDAEGPVLEEETNSPWIVHEPLEFLVDEAAQAFCRLSDARDLVRNVQHCSRHQRPVQDGVDELILSLEVEYDEPMAQLRLRGHCAECDRIDSGTQCDLMRGAQYLFAAFFLRSSRSRHADLPQE